MPEEEELKAKAKALLRGFVLNDLRYWVAEMEKPNRLENGGIGLDLQHRRETLQTLLEQYKLATED
jgi:hypothetical protein